MTFQYCQPFRTTDGDIVTMKALVTMHGEQAVEVHENNLRYAPAQLVPISTEEYEEYMNNDFL